METDLLEAHIAGVGCNSSTDEGTTRLDWQCANRIMYRYVYISTQPTRHCAVYLINCLVSQGFTPNMWLPFSQTLKTLVNQKCLKLTRMTVTDRGQWLIDFILYTTVSVIVCFAL